MAHCVYGVRLSVTSRRFIETARWIELIFSIKATFGSFYTVVYRNMGISKNKVTSQTLNLAHFYPTIR